MFLALLHNDWSALGYITSYNELYNWFFRTLTQTSSEQWQHCSWTWLSPFLCLRSPSEEDIAEADGNWTGIMWIHGRPRIAL